MQAKFRPLAMPPAWHIALIVVMVVVCAAIIRYMDRR